MNRALLAWVFSAGGAVFLCGHIAMAGSPPMGGNGFYVIPYAPPVPPAPPPAPLASPGVGQDGIWAEPAPQPQPLQPALSPAEMASPWVPNMTGGALPGELNGLPPAVPAAPPPPAVAAVPLPPPPVPPPVPPTPPASPARSAPPNVAQAPAAAALPVPPVPPGGTGASSTNETMPSSMVAVTNASSPKADASATDQRDVNKPVANKSETASGGTGSTRKTDALDAAHEKATKAPHQGGLENQEDLREFVSKIALWHAQQGHTLDEVLGDWADKAGWTLVFNSKMIYELQASANFDGDFISAASALIKSIRAMPQPLATFYRGNKTLVISNHSDQEN